jgi:branched-subunit amino acid transport protein
MNLVAILVAAVVCFIIGFLFHGPLLGKLWMRLANIVPTGNEKLSDMVPQMLYNLLANILTATIIEGVLWAAFPSGLIGERTAFRGAIVAAWLWLGFIVTSTSMDVIWMKASKKLWLFEITSSLVCMIAMGAILAGWN